MELTCTDCNKLDRQIDEVVVAVLAKDKEHCLPAFLQCLWNQRYPKKKIHLYIRTNNNNDKTVEVLEKWIKFFGPAYGSVFFDKTDVKERVQDFGQHEWNSIRFSILGKIRQDSINHAISKNCHYFVVDCDNFIRPNTLLSLISSGLPVVAPFLRTVGTLYSNYHHCVDPYGYFAECSHYLNIWNMEVRGFVQCSVVHCTYFIRNKYLKHISYDDGTGRHEYVIFSHTLREKNIPQYLDNREVYGVVSFAENKVDVEPDISAI
jgi:hypothetical protein